MLVLKKIGLIYMTLTSGLVCAGNMGAVCKAANVTMPCENKAWDISGRALYIQPFNLSTVGTPGSTPTYNQTYTYGDGATVTDNNDFSINYGWGFQLEGGIIFSNEKDFKLDWYHYRGGHSSSIDQPIKYYQEINLPTQIYFSTIGRNESKKNAWDQVNMEFSVSNEFPLKILARLHGGAQFARVSSNEALSSITGFINDDYSVFRISNYWNKNQSWVYNGFGPRVGAELTHIWGNRLSIYSAGALGLLAGSSKSSSEFGNFNPSPVVGNYQSNQLTTSSEAKVVPTLDAKLGLMYTHTLAQGNLSLDVGWLWNAYFGAFGDSNFSIQGLYFGAKWLGNLS